MKHLVIWSGLAALGGLIMWAYRHTPPFVRMGYRPTQIWYDRDEYWGDI